MVLLFLLMFEAGDWSLQALNELAGFKYDKLSQQPCRPPTKVQQQMIEHVQQLVQDSGGPPEGLNGRTSLAHLARTISWYDETPSNLADYDISKIKILRGQVRPKDLADREIQFKWKLASCLRFLTGTQS